MWKTAKLLVWIPMSVIAVGEIEVSYVGTDDVSTMVKTFNNWIDANGGETWSKIVVKEIPGFRLGTAAREDIKQDDVYLALPWKMVISEDKIATSDAVVAFDALKKKNDFDLSLLLIAYLFHEKEKGIASFWKPYIDLLPASFNIPLLWSPEDLAELQGTSIPEESNKWNQGVSTQFQKFKAALQTRHGAEIFSATFITNFNLEQFRWASAVLDSRTIWVDGRYRCFLPMLDMVNCKDHPTRKHSTTRNLETDSTNTRAIWAVKSGEQLFENYATTNRDNLMYHGFVLEQNSFDSIQFQLPAAATVMSDRPSLLPILRGARLQPRHKIQLGDFPVGLLGLARVLALADGEEKKARVLGHNFASTPYSDVNERNALELIDTECKKRLEKNYATAGVIVDEEALRATHADGTYRLQGNRRTATVYRLQQKHVLTSVRDRIMEQVQMLSKEL